MGCDIHIFVECKKSANGEKRWVNVDKWKILPDYFDDSFEPTFECEHLYADRNYYIFSILANVRNDDRVKYISKPRGLPSNVSKIVNKEYTEDGAYHSCSWLTLDELKTFNKQNKQNILDPLINILQEKKESYDWMNGKRDSSLRIVFWFDS
uniref:Uncharacterized protein n=1 Tax=Marseillevirus LCMAC101 TaxID=2506602 RepID=A0A481YT14_9VIRU|nr:MAG: hypothetical protein LCMAC101_07250 [Marseillevirus LCMAC101]